MAEMVAESRMPGVLQKLARRRVVNKRRGNVIRDRRNRRRLRTAGWSILVVWECWTKDIDRKLIPRLNAFLTRPERLKPPEQ